MTELTYREQLEQLRDKYAAESALHKATRSKTRSLFDHTIGAVWTAIGLVLISTILLAIAAFAVAVLVMAAMSIPHMFMTYGGIFVILFLIAAVSYELRDKDAS